MRRKKLGFMIGIVVVLSMTVPAVAVPVNAEITVDMERDNDFPYAENTAVLKDYDYRQGEISENGWKNEFLRMSYLPGSGIHMGINENEELNKYYARHGKEEIIAWNEMVARNEGSGYLQLMVEVNPNHEAAEDILQRFVALEKLEMVSKQKEINLGGKKMLTCTGVFDKEKYLLGVSDVQEDLVIALKVRYENVNERKKLLSGFEDPYEGEYGNEEAHEVHFFDGMELNMPSEFEEAAEIVEEN